MKETPILFSGEMVRAILDGRKTQTRRLVKPQPFHGVVNESGNLEDEDEAFSCPYGQPGDRLWVRETFGLWCHSVESVGVEYAAGGEDKIVDFPGGEGMPSLEQQCRKNIGGGRRKRPSIFMPRWACRLTLEITAVRVHRLQDITESDAIAEGVNSTMPFKWRPDEWQNQTPNIARYAGLWDSINAKRGFGWDKNPWVWVITFRKL